MHHETRPPEGDARREAAAVLLDLVDAIDDTQALVDDRLEPPVAARVGEAIRAARFSLTVAARRAGSEATP